MISLRNPLAACRRCSGRGLVRCPECRALYYPGLVVGVFRCPLCHGLGYVRCPECFEERIGGKAPSEPGTNTQSNRHDCTGE
jgi:hypothetical protein